MLLAWAEVSVDDPLHLSLKLLGFQFVLAVLGVVEEIKHKREARFLYGYLNSRPSTVVSGKLRTNESNRPPPHFTPRAK
jgi:hypothetical protein